MKESERNKLFKELEAKRQGTEANYYFEQVQEVRGLKTTNDPRLFLDEKGHLFAVSQDAFGNFRIERLEIRGGYFGEIKEPKHRGK